MLFTVCVARLQQGLGVAGGVPTVEVAALECCAPAEGSEDAPAPFAVLDVDFFDEELLVVVYRPREGEGEPRLVFSRASAWAPGVASRRPQAAEGSLNAHHDRRAAACVATVGYANLIYHPIPAPHAYVTGTTREWLMGAVRAALASGEVWVHCPLWPFRRRRYADHACPLLPACFSGTFFSPTPSGLNARFSVCAQLPSAGASPIIQSRALKGCREGGVTLAVNGGAGRRVSCVLDGTGLAVEVLDMAGEEEELELEEEAGEEGAEGSG